MHGWAHGCLGELGEGIYGQTGTASLSDPSSAPQRSGQGNRATAAAGHGLVLAGSWLPAPPFALCMAFPRRLNLRHLLLHPILISLAGLPRHISVDPRQLATHPLCQGISQQAKPPSCS